MAATCTMRMTVRGTARPTRSHSFNVISAQTRNSESATVPRSSTTRWEMPDGPGRVVEIAQDRCGQHRADVRGQCEPGSGEGIRQPRPAPHRREDQHEGLQEPVGLDVFTRRRCRSRLCEPVFHDVRRHGAARRAVARARRSADALHEQRADGSTDHSTGDDPDHRGRHGECRRAGHPGLFEERREGQAGRRPACQRDRPGQHAHERVLAEQPGRSSANDVL